MDDGPPLKRRAEGGEEPASKLPRLVPPPVDNVVVEVVNKEEDIVRYRAAVAGAPRVTAKRSGRPSDVDGREGDPDRRAQAAAAPEAGDEFEVRGIEAKYVERNGRVLYKVRWANGDATKVCSMARFIAEDGI